MEALAASIILYHPKIQNATYDTDGNLASMKSSSNGQLIMEKTDYVWGDKQNTHKDIVYANGAPMMTNEVTQHYK